MNRLIYALAAALLLAMPATAKEITVHPGTSFAPQPNGSWRACQGEDRQRCIDLETQQNTDYLRNPVAIVVLRKGSSNETKIICGGDVTQRNTCIQKALRGEVPKDYYLPSPARRSTIGYCIGRQNCVQVLPTGRMLPPPPPGKPVVLEYFPTGHPQTDPQHEVQRLGEANALTKQ